MTQLACDRQCVVLLNVLLNLKFTNSQGTCCGCLLCNLLGGACNAVRTAYCVNQQRHVQGGVCSFCAVLWAYAI